MKWCIISTKTTQTIKTSVDTVGTSAKDNEKKHKIVLTCGLMGYLNVNLTCEGKVNDNWICGQIVKACDL